MIASKANKIVHIKDYQMNAYLDNGFDIYADDGKLIQKCVPTNLIELRSEYAKQCTIIAKLTEQNESLKSQLASQTAQVDALNKQLVALRLKETEEKAVVAPVAPKTTRAKKPKAE